VRRYSIQTAYTDLWSVLVAYDFSYSFPLCHDLYNCATSDSIYGPPPHTTQSLPVRPAGSLING